MQRDPHWQPRYRSGPKVDLVPAVPYKFLDIGTKMGSYKLGEHIPGRNDVDNIYHPRFTRHAIPPVNTFHAVVHGRTSRWIPNIEGWCLEEAWFDHSITYDFRVIDPPGHIWGLPVLVPTCPKKLFSEGPRHKYVDIVVMIKLKWVDIIHGSGWRLLLCRSSHGTKGM